MNLHVTPRQPAASEILNQENPMYFGHHAPRRESAFRREQRDLVLLSQEMEARHLEMLRLMETSRQKLKTPIPARSVAP